MRTAAQNRKISHNLPRRTPQENAPSPQTLREIAQKIYRDGAQKKQKNKKQKNKKNKAKQKNKNTGKPGENTNKYKMYIKNQNFFFRNIAES